MQTNMLMFNLTEWSNTIQNVDFMYYIHHNTFNKIFIVIVVVYNNNILFKKTYKWECQKPMTPGELNTKMTGVKEKKYIMYSHIDGCSLPG